MSFAEEYFLENCFTAIEQQSMRYFTACEAEKTHYNTVEKLIQSVLIPSLEKALTQDALAGGKHNIIKKTYNGMNVLLTDAGFFSNYQMIKVGNTLYNYHRSLNKIPWEGSRDMITEGNVLIDMIDEFSRCNCEDDYEHFQHKYYKSPAYKGKHEFVKSVQTVLSKKLSPITWFDAYGTDVDFELDYNNELLYAVYQFCSQNMQYTNEIPQIIGGKLYMGKHQVYEIQGKFHLSASENYEEDFSLYGASLYLILEEKKQETGLVKKADGIHYVEDARRAIPIWLSFSRGEAAEFDKFFKEQIFAANLCCSKTPGRKVSMKQEYDCNRQQEIESSRRMQAERARKKENGK